MIRLLKKSFQREMIVPPVHAILDKASQALPVYFRELLQTFAGGIKDVVGLISLPLEYREEDSVVIIPETVAVVLVKELRVLLPCKVSAAGRNIDYYIQTIFVRDLFCIIPEILQLLFRQDPRIIHHPGRFAVMEAFRRFRSSLRIPLRRKGKTFHI